MSADTWELQSIKFPVKCIAISEIVQHLELAQIMKNILQKLIEHIMSLFEIRVVQSPVLDSS